MPIPSEILAVKRPSNTKVKKSGNHYYVVTRTCKRINGKNIPVETGTIGKIINGQYIPYEKTRIPNLTLSQADVLDYGNIMFAYNQSKELLDELKLFYSNDDSAFLYTVSLLRACYGNLTNRDIQFRYDTSFISTIFKNLPLSKNSIVNKFDIFGRHTNEITKFMNNRISKMSNNSLALIDGMLVNYKSNKSKYSERSRKSKVKGRQNISIIYAFDSETGEPVASKVYPGNSLDCTSFYDFLDTFEVTKGTIIADKGFSTKELKNVLINKKVNFIIPCKRSSTSAKKAIKKISKKLEYKDEQVTYTKIKENDIYLYAFKNHVDAANEDNGYLKNLKSEFNSEKYNAKKETFGTIVFESNLDLEPIDVYLMYEKRWQVEVSFNFYKNIVELESTRVHSDVRVITSSFIDYLATIITIRMKRFIVFKNLHKDYSFKQIMNYLTKLEVCIIPGSKEQNKIKKTLKYIEELAHELELI